MIGMHSLHLMTKNELLWFCQKVCDALSYFLDCIFVRFGTNLHRQIVGILMGTDCAPLEADSFLFCMKEIL